MEEWYCFKCEEKMEESDLCMEYMEIVRFQPGLKCPKCGTGYLMEKIVVEVISPGEDEIEEKF